MLLYRKCKKGYGVEVTRRGPLLTSQPFRRYGWRQALPGLESVLGEEKSKFDSVEFYLEHASFLYQEGH